MSNLWFNIRFGKYHWQLSNNWKMGFGPNQFWDDNPETYKYSPWFRVYCAFGKHFL